MIIIDAVNQLEQLDHAHSMQWLPQVLPKNVRVVISTLAGEAHDAMLRRRVKPQEETVTGLTAPEIRELAATYLGEIRHQFPNPAVERDFDRKVEQGNPLYILVALEELRVFGEFEELGSRINRLPDNVPALFDQVLERIESDFTPALVRDCMAYIACGRHGMTAEELQTLLKAHAPRLDANAEAPKLPDMLWSRLYRSLSTYLFERSGVIDFFHGQLKEAVGKRYLHEESSREAAATHLALADFFEGRPRDERQLEELPWQLQQGGAWSRLATLLGDLNFLGALNGADYNAPQAYWAVLEMESPHKACDTYREVLEHPRADVRRTMHVVSVISALGYSQEALVATEAVTDLLREDGHTDLATTALLAQAGMRRMASQPGQALALVDEALSVYRQAGGRQRVISCLQERVNLLGLLDRPREKVACLDELERACREVGDSRAMAECSVERASLLDDAGRLGEALEILAQAERTARDLGDRSLLIGCLNVRTSIAGKRGSTREELALCVEMERLCRESGENLRMATCLMSQARLLVASPATRQEALEKCREAQAIFSFTNRAVELREARLFEASVTTGVSGMARLSQPVRVGINSVVCLVVITVGVALGLWNRWLWLLGGPLALFGAGNLLMGLFPGLMVRNYRMAERLSAEIHEDEVRRRGH